MLLKENIRSEAVKKSDKTAENASQEITVTTSEVVKFFKKFIDTFINFQNDIMLGAKPSFNLLIKMHSTVIGLFDKLNNTYLKLMTMSLSHYILFFFLKKYASSIKAYSHDDILNNFRSLSREFVTHNLDLTPPSQKLENHDAYYILIIDITIKDIINSCQGHFTSDSLDALLKARHSLEYFITHSAEKPNKALVAAQYILSRLYFVIPFTRYKFFLGVFENLCSILDLNALLKFQSEQKAKIAENLPISLENQGLLCLFDLYYCQSIYYGTLFNYAELDNNFKNTKFTELFNHLKFDEIISCLTELIKTQTVRSHFLIPDFMMGFNLYEEILTLSTQILNTALTEAETTIKSLNPDKNDPLDARWKELNTMLDFKLAVISIIEKFSVKKHIVIDDHNKKNSANKSNTNKLKEKSMHMLEQARKIQEPDKVQEEIERWVSEIERSTEKKDRLVEARKKSGAKEKTAHAKNMIKIQSEQTDHSTEKKRTNKKILKQANKKSSTYSFKSQFSNELDDITKLINIKEFTQALAIANKLLQESDQNNKELIYIYLSLGNIYRASSAEFNHTNRNHLTSARKYFNKCLTHIKQEIQSVATNPSMWQELKSHVNELISQMKPAPPPNDPEHNPARLTVIPKSESTNETSIIKVGDAVDTKDDARSQINLQQNKQVISPEMSPATQCESDKNEGKEVPFEINLPNYIELIMSRILKQCHAVYIVGGAVRDAILKQDAYDYDLVTTAKMLDLKEIFSSEGFITGKLHPVFRIDTPNGKSVQISPLQKKPSLVTKEDLIETVEIEGSYIILYRSKERLDDAAKRDFTCNAMYYDIEKKVIYDYFNGYQHTLQRQLVCIKENTFREDPYRILRAIRLMARYNFTLSDDMDNEIKINMPLLSYQNAFRLNLEISKTLFDQPIDDIYSYIKKYRILNVVYGIENSNECIIRFVKLVLSKSLWATYFLIWGGILYNQLEMLIKQYGKQNVIINYTKLFNTVFIQAGISEFYWHKLGLMWALHIAQRDHLYNLIPQYTLQDCQLAYQFSGFLLAAKREQEIKTIVKQGFFSGISLHSILDNINKTLSQCFFSMKIIQNHLSLTLSFHPLNQHSSTACPTETSQSRNLAKTSKDIIDVINYLQIKIPHFNWYPNQYTFVLVFDNYTALNKVKRVFQNYITNKVLQPQCYLEQRV